MSAVLQYQEEKYRSEALEALEATKPPFHNDMRAGNTNME
jgi:hypothetical protein